MPPPEAWWLPPQLAGAARPAGLVTVAARAHPFRAAVQLSYAREGRTLAELLQAAQPDPALRRHAVILIDDWEIPAERWHCVRPRAGRQVTIAVRPAGGKNALRIMLTIAVIAASIVAPYALGIAGTLGGALLAGGIAAAGGILVNQLVPAAVPKLGRASSPAATYGIAGGRNEARPFQPVPVVLGQHRMTPPLGARTFTEIVGSDQYLRMLVVWDQGAIALTSLKIGETPIGEFDDVEIEHRIAAAELATPLALYARQVGEEPLDILLSQKAGWQQRRTETETQEISFDLTFPLGLLSLRKSGDKDPRQVDFEVETRVVGASGWTSQGTRSVNAQSTSLLRTGRRVKGLAKGQYDIRIRRTTPDADDPVFAGSNTTRVDECHWTALRSINNDDPIALVGLARTAVRIRATDQLSGVVDQLNGVVQALIKDWDAGSGAWIVRATRNPASAYRHVLQGAPAARPLPDARLDLEGLQAWHVYCAAKGYTYDAVIDYATSARDLLREIAAAGRASPTLSADMRWGVVVDQPKATPVQVFTPRNSRGFQGEKVFADRPHAFRVRFLNRAKGWQQDERIVYDDGYSEANATLIEGLELPGVTTSDLAFQHARYFHAVGKLRPETYSFEADLEHIVCTRGDMIRVAHDVPLWGLGWGRIKAIVGGGEDRVTEDGEDRVTEAGVLLVTEGAATGVVLDETVVMEAGQSYRLRVRRNDAGTDVYDVVTEPGSTDELTFVEALAPGTGPQPGDLWAFGLSSLVTTQLLVRWIEPGADLGARLTCIDYAPDALKAGEAGIPEFNSRISLPAGSVSPLVLDIRSDEAVLQRAADGTLRPRIVISLHNDSQRPIARLQGIRTRYRILGGGDEVWLRVTDPPDVVEVSLTAVEEGESYQLQLRYLYLDGTPAPWTTTFTHVVVGLATLPPDVEDVTIDRLQLLWRYPEPPSDLVGFLVRLLPGWDWGAVSWGLARPAHVGVLGGPPHSLAAVPPGPWTVLVKAVDAGGHESAAAALALLSVSEPVADNIVEQIDLAAAGWPGEIAGGSVVAGELVADDSAVYLAAPSALYLEDPDADYLPTEAKEMVWEAAVELPAYLQAGDAVRAQALVEGVWTLEWAAAGELASVGYRPWSGGIDAIAVLASSDPRLMLRLTTEGGGRRGAVSGFAVLVDPPDVSERLAGVSIADVGTRLPVVKSYREIRSVVVTIVGSGQAAARVADKDPALGPLVEVLDFAGTQTAGTVDALVVGY